jgi:ABC-type Mn2+/Zn2+ transport system permease subunit
VLVGAAAIALAARVPGIERDTAVGIVITSLFGLGVLIALAPSSPPGVQSLLFGDLLGVAPSDLATAAGLTAAVLAVLAVLHRRLLAVGFDRRSAAALGLRPLPAELALLALVAGATLIAVRGLGNLLVAAVLVGPAASARLLTRRVPAMMTLAVGLAAACGIGGLYLSYYAGTAGGASVAGLIVLAYLALRAAVSIAARRPLSR